jgi:hypothetical protein
MEAFDGGLPSRCIRPGNRTVHRLFHPGTVDCGTFHDQFTVSGRRNGG